MSMTLIESKTLGTAQASIEFTSIPQDGTDLLILTSLRDNLANPTSSAKLQFNASAATNYSLRRLRGTGSAAASDSFASQSSIGGNHINGATSTADTFASGMIYITNYSQTVAKSVSIDATAENNATATALGINAGLWSLTAAITSIQITPEGTSFAVGSTISLYKITKGSDGIVTVS
jgi:hypothetical protein